MGGLAHYLERDGIATTQISLVREHTERILPPRALWVPFELGRPFGEPGDAAFQKRVVIAALELLEERQGPIIADYPEESPGETDYSGWACPIHLPDPAPPQSSTLEAVLAEEIACLKPWHGLAARRRGRSTFGVLGLEIDDVARFLVAYVENAPIPTPREGVSLSEALVFASEDLRAFYLEAAMAQPGRASSTALNQWFQRRTVAGSVVAALRDRQ